REYQDNLFACCFNMRKVTRHVLQPHGATFKTEAEDFVVSNNLDFHPTDTLEDADGSLLIVDTGGWYKLCCPTSQLAKPDVLGAIYRVKKKEWEPKFYTGPVPGPYGRNYDWKELATPSDDKNVEETRLRRLIFSIQQDDRYVRERATRAIAKHGDAAVKAIIADLTKSALAYPKPLALVWALGRIEKSSARAAIRKLLADKHPDIVQVALQFISLWRDQDVLADFGVNFASASPSVQRAIAEVFGRIGDAKQTQTLLWFSHQFSGDRFLEHSITYALIELGDSELLHEAIASGFTPLGNVTLPVGNEKLQIPGAGSRLRLRPSCLRIALIALDQMPNGGLKPEEVAKHLTSPEPLLRETAAWIISRHADWGEALAGYLRERLASGELTDAEQKTLGQQLAQFAKAASVQDLLAATAHDAKLPVSARLTALNAMRDSKLKELPKSWSAALQAVLALVADADGIVTKDFDLIELAVKTVRAIPPHKDDAASWRAPLLVIAAKPVVLDQGGASVDDPTDPANVRIDVRRLDALAAIPGGLTAAELSATKILFDFLINQLDSARTVAQRGTAAEVLSKAKLTPAQLTRLTEEFKTAGPLEVDRLLGAFEQTTDEQVGQKLIAQLKTAPALTALRVDAIKTRLAKYSPSVQEAAQPLYAALNVDLGKQRQQLEEMLASLPPGDIVRGQRVFHNEKAACKACHALGYLGGKTGPDLTRIGGIRNERDLLESILFPSASFVRSFEPVLIVTTSGKTVNGLIRSETPDELVIATGPNQEARVARADIEEMKPSSVSIMPAGLEKQLTKEQLADLIAFLKNCK
ncbi:MAG: c-type cytochrome, partial [Planctomycetaceae bacterium]|nr:c-type cytochrome [Planctomycetaceae bacterium]